MIGHPVRHSLSPLLHNAAFAALGLDWAYVAFDVAAPDLAGAMVGVRALGIEGLSVTMPHKEAVLVHVDRASPVAERLGAANTVHRLGGSLVAENTDGPGFIDALRVDEGFEVQGRRCAVVGAGGAGRAVVLALADEGAAAVTVVNRSPEPAARAAALAGDRGALGPPEAVQEADLVVNATPLGMAGVAADRLPVPRRLLGAGQVVVDLVYHPIHTPLLAAAKEQGAVAVSGLGMLIHQAGRAFRLWTGENAPLGAMSAAVVAVLSSEEVHQR